MKKMKVVNVQRWKSSCDDHLTLKLHQQVTCSVSENWISGVFEIHKPIISLWCFSFLGMPKLWFLSMKIEKNPAFFPFDVCCWHKTGDWVSPVEVTKSWSKDKIDKRISASLITTKQHDGQFCVFFFFYSFILFETALATLLCTLATSSNSLTLNSIITSTLKPCVNPETDLWSGEQEHTVRENSRHGYVRNLPLLAFWKKKKKTTVP